MMEYEPLPSRSDLAQIETATGRSFVWERRVLGGQSATTDILRASDGTRVALRRHGRWSVGFDDGIATREEAVLGAVAAGGVAVPSVLWAGPLGPATAILTEFVVGAAIIQPVDPIRWASQLAATLAAIHSVPVSPELAEALHQAPPAPVDLETPPLLIAHPRGLKLMELRSELKRNRDAATKLVHGDFWPGNLLWLDNEVAAVLDWEAAVLGDPASDVAYCYAEMRYLGLEEAADHFMHAYQRITGATLASLPYWIVTALCRAVPELDTFVDGWKPLGYRPDFRTVQSRLDALIDETLGKWSP